MLRTLTFRQVTYDLHVTIAGRRKQTWRFELPFGISGEGVTMQGVEVAFEMGQRAAERAINREFDE